MAHSLAPITNIPCPSPRRSPSRSPHKHVLRPRRSFQRISFSPKPAHLSDTDKLRSPLKLADGRPNTASGQKPQDAPPQTGRGRGGRGGAMLFPASPVYSSNQHAAIPPPATASSSARAPAPLKKLAHKLSGAFTAKSKTGRAKQPVGLEGFDWNDDLAAIASDPSSSSSSPPRVPLESYHRPPVSLASISTSAASQVPSDDLVTPTAYNFPPQYVPSRPRGGGGSASLSLSSDSRELPGETRRRKSDEMDDADRPSIHAAAPPVRHDTHSHNRTHSLAHAHSLRSSRTLSSSFGPADTALRNHLPSSLASTSSNPPPSFGSPFTPSVNNSHSHLYPHSQSLAKPHHPIAFPSSFPPKTRDSDPRYRDSSTSNAPPPSKKISVECLGSIADGDEDDDSEVFGGGTIMPTPARKSVRAKSLSRPSNPVIVIPTSSSHPGWSGDGFDSATSNRTGAQHPGSLSPEVALRTRSRALSTLSNLEALSEAGPAVDQFSHATRDTTVDAFPFLSSNVPDAVTPPRRRSEGFNLFGGSLPTSPPSAPARRVKKASEARMLGNLDAERRGTSMPDFAMTDETGDADRAPSPLFDGGRRDSVFQIPTSTSSYTFPSRRAASHDSLFVNSSQCPPPSSTSNHGREGNVRKRNSNGALLVGSGAPTGSRLAAASPIVAHTSSPAPWHARDTGDLDEEDEDEDDLAGDCSWDRSTSPAPPSLTDGTTSASSSLSTSLSSHAGGDNVGIVDGRSSPGISVLSGSGSLGSFTPQNYNDVRPLQAAFMSAGLISKHARPRDSGVGMSPFAHAPVKSTSEGAFDLSTSSISLEPTVAMKPLANPVLAGLSRPAPVMPDTPVKRPAFTLSSDAAVEAAEESAADTEEDEPSVVLPPRQSSSSSPNLSPPSDAADSMSWSPNRSPLSPRSTDGSSDGGASQATILASPLGSQRSGDDLSPTSALASRNGRRPPGWKRPPLFRRRSSGQLSSEGGGFLSVSGGGSFRSISSSSSGRTMMLDREPMTPTRSVGGGSAWSEAAQLVVSPSDFPLATPATPGFPLYINPFAMAGQSSYIPPVSHHPVPPLATPNSHGRQSFPLSEVERRQQPLGVGRAQFRTRGSGSVLQSLAEQELPPSNFFESNYTLLSTIGSGAFSHAYEVFDKPRNGVFAVKKTRNPFGGAKDRLRRLEEVDILRLMAEQPSPHLISLVDAWEQSGHLFIQTELCAGGNLHVFLEEYGREHEVLDETRVWKILSEVALGVAHLHERNVIHLDLKPANVFIDKDGHLKIGDFGLSTRWPRADPLSIFKGAAVPSPGWERERDSWRTEPGERRVRAKSNGDTPEELEREGDREYIAPEILGGRYGKEADVFSLGLIILEAAANVVLPDNGPAWHKLRSNDFSDVDLSHLSEPLVRLLAGMLDKSPDRRLTIDDVLRQPVVARLVDVLRSQPQAISGAVVAEDDDFLYRLVPEMYEARRAERASSENRMDVD